MAHIKNYEQFINDIGEKSFRPYMKSFQELAGIRPTGANAKRTHLIQQLNLFNASGES